MRLLVIEDSELDYEVLIATLALQGVVADAIRVESAGGLLQALQRGPWDLVISDHHLPGFSSGQALGIVRAQADPPPFIIVSGMIGEDAAVEAMRRGADDYLIKGRLARLGMAARNAVAGAQLRREAAQAQKQLAQSQVQLRNLSNRLQAMLEEERVSIARDIHDDIGGSLTAIKFDLDSLRRHVDPAQLERLERAQATLASASSASQRILQDLRPPVLDAGLGSALEFQVRQHRQRLGIEIMYRCHSEAAKLDGLPAMAVYRACQEALTNIAKHAQAKQVTVDLHCSAQTVSLEVTDDGVGLPPGALDKPLSVGLRGLAERAAAAGGGMDISSAGGRTTFVLWVARDATSAPLQATEVTGARAA